MPAIDFKLPRGAILFTDDEFAYEFREDLGEAHHGLSLFLARRRTLEGDHPRGKVLLKAVGRQTFEAGARIKRARAKLEEPGCARSKGSGMSSPNALPATT